MKLHHAKRIVLITTALVSATLTLLLFGGLVLAGIGEAAAAPGPHASDVRQASASTVISGTYVGTVVITEPIALGMLDLAFTLEAAGGAFSGAVDSTRTLVFAGAPALHGSITGSVNGITPTLTIASDPFVELVSGRELQRSFTLVGEVHAFGDTLQGDYNETMEGLTPEPLIVHGTFLVTRSTPSCTSFTVQDLQAAVDRWGASQNDIDYESAYDRNHDGVIDIMDIMMMATSLNRNCP